MKKILLALIASLGVFLGSWSLAFATSNFTVARGGTGAATLTGCLTGNGTGAITGSGTCNTSNATVSSVGTGTGLTGGTITTTGTWAASDLTADSQHA